VNNVLIAMGRAQESILSPSPDHDAVWFAGNNFKVETPGDNPFAGLSLNPTQQAWLSLGESEYNLPWLDTDEVWTGHTWWRLRAAEAGISLCNPGRHFQNGYQDKWEIRYLPDAKQLLGGIDSAYRQSVLAHCYPSISSGQTPIAFALPLLVTPTDLTQRAIDILIQMMRPAVTFIMPNTIPLANVNAIEVPLEGYTWNTHAPIR
jgi:hypothetical protein